MGSGGEGDRGAEEAPGDADADAGEAEEDEEATEGAAAFAALKLPGDVPVAHAGVDQGRFGGLQSGDDRAEMKRAMPAARRYQGAEIMAALRIPGPQVRPRGTTTTKCSSHR